jgi:hypothetical protein
LAQESCLNEICQSSASAYALKHNGPAKRDPSGFARGWFSSPGANRKSFPSAGDRPSQSVENHSQLIGRRKVPLRIRSADWLLVYFDSKRVLFGLLAANAAVVLTLTLFVFFG